MSRTKFVARLLPAMAALSLAALAGCASTPRDKSMDASRVASNDKTAIPAAGCVSDTGSRIQRKGEQCNGPGRTFSQDDLQRTGEFNAGDALRKLDPSIQ